MNNNKNTSNSSSVYEDEKIFKILEKVLSEGSVSVINRSNEIVGSLDKETISKFIYN
jgi:tyrosyl-tRNA synthetase